MLYLGASQSHSTIFVQFSFPHRCKPCWIEVKSDCVARCSDIRHVGGLQQLNVVWCDGTVMPGCYHKLSESDERAVLYSNAMVALLAACQAANISAGRFFFCRAISKKQEMINHHIGPFLWLLCTLSKIVCAVCAQWLFHYIMVYYRVHSLLMFSLLQVHVAFATQQLCHTISPTCTSQITMHLVTIVPFFTQRVFQVTMVAMVFSGVLYFVK